MTPTVYAAAAAAVAFWPQIIALFTSAKAGVPPQSYQSAIASLADVRLRLLKTDRLDGEQKKAMDVLTLALVDGSDL
jgi:hypothetical protein